MRTPHPTLSSPESIFIQEEWAFNEYSKTLFRWAKKQHHQKAQAPSTPHDERKRDVSLVIPTDPEEAEIPPVALGRNRIPIRRKEPCSPFSFSPRKEQSNGLTKKTKTMIATDKTKRFLRPPAFAASSSLAGISEEEPLLRTTAEKGFDKENTSNPLA
ncbi:hypothetical protein QOT17_006161 [Balamuthia mandrillaris]